MISILVINGPNLASLGTREPAVYGETSAGELESQIRNWGNDAGFNIVFEQSDQEGCLVSAIHSSSEKENCKAMIINPGGFSHTSVALLDAMRAFKGPVIEIHISQIHRREPYRHRMLTAGAADTVISGAGTYGYYLAMETAKEMLRR